MSPNKKAPFYYKYHPPAVTDWGELLEGSGMGVIDEVFSHKIKTTPLDTEERDLLVDKILDELGLNYEEGVSFLTEMLYTIQTEKRREK